MKFVVSIPTSVIVEVEADDEEALTEDFLMDAVVEQHNKYITVDARHIGYDNFTVLDASA